MNLLSLSQAQENLTSDGFSNFTKHHGIKIKSKEVEGLRNLVLQLIENGSNVADFEEFYIGYEIPQIGKEFDLLRFGHNFILNIELKISSTEEKILKQLKRNDYYLKFIGRTAYHLTYVSDTNTLYNLNENGTLDQADLAYLAELLEAQEVDIIEDANKLFNPSDYLISPFNSTDRFLNGEYFLTSQQEEVQFNILKAIQNTKQENFISLTGSAGTGKTLLAYDIAKRVMDEGKKSLILHCGQINCGQRNLIDSGWTIKPIKSYKSCDFSNYDLILIDEAQRLYENQLEHIYIETSKAKSSCLFSYDRLQTLAHREEKEDSSGKILKLCSKNSYSLSEKIRSNKEIANFIKSLLDNKRNFGKTEGGNIHIRYFSNPDDARFFLTTLDGEEWKVLRFTPSQYKTEFHERYSDNNRMTSHEVIGQEFDGVAVVIDKFFTYSDVGKLLYRGSTYYLPTKMLFQNITRARKRLLVVVVQNEELLDRCMAIT